MILAFLGPDDADLVRHLDTLLRTGHDDLVDLVVQLGLSSPAADVFRDALRAAGQAGDDRTRGHGPVDEIMEPAAAGPRYVNVSLADGHHALGRAAPLTPGARYDLRVDIGRLSPESVVEHPEEHPFPTDLLPPSEDGHWLEVVAVSDEFGVEHRRHNLFLPTVGPSFVCPCEPGGRHRCTPGDRSPYLRVPLTMPAEAGLARLRLSLYYEKNVVQSQLLTARVGGAVGNCSSRVDYTLTATLADVGFLPARTLNVLTNDNGEGTHRVVVNGRTDDVAAFRLSEGQMAAAIGAIRAALLDIHIDQVGNSRRNRYDSDNRKPYPDLVADVGRLAGLGWTLWNTLLAPDPDLRARVRAQLQPGPATVQVSRAGGSAFVFPWALLYDIPLESRAERHRPCAVLEEWKRAALAFGGEPPPTCPHAADHKLNVICPYGFWGFAHVIEQPPSMPPGRSLPLVIAHSPGSAQLVVGLSLDLDRRLLDAHLAALRDRMAGFTVVDCDSVDEIADGLGAAGLELVYFYCHGRRGDNGAGASLGVGQDEQILPEDLVAWADGLWATDHWSAQSPLVVINGCHTAEVAPDSLVSFVDAFAGVRAAGVVGTEIAVHQQVAGEAALELLDGVRAEQSVGEALARMRRRLLAKGNVLGLAYTPYCSASLRLTG